VRQPFTESGDIEKDVIQAVLDLIGSSQVNVLTGLESQSQETFRKTFERNTGMPFTPQNFRLIRLSMLAAADAMIVIRTSLSESGAFEAAYNVFGARQVPIFAAWENAPIKTTPLREQDEFCEAEYAVFKEPEELRERLTALVDRVDRLADTAPAKSWTA